MTPPAPVRTSRPDPLTPDQRRRNMSAVRGKDTRPEMLIRRGLHAAGFRYRLHGPGLPGRPDLVFPGRKAVIFVHGCFWHGHDCPLFRFPSTRQEFWETKIGRNQQRDAKVAAKLKAAGWRVLNIWECALRGPERLPQGDVIAMAGLWLEAGAAETGEFRGVRPA
jgi:DNA mismatch endonuclease (patch repair protein)